MSKRDDIMKIWQESFSDSRSYVTMYFDRVYRDDEALVIADESGVTASSLLLQHYSMTFHGSTFPVGYIAGAATRRSRRGHGYMSRLMNDALKASAARGDMLVSLIPARSALYFFYEKFGFSTVFYNREQRFTSLHRFPTEGEYSSRPAESIASDDLWSAFDSLQHLRPCYITHSRRDLDNIVADLDEDGGDFVVVESDDEDHGPHISAMAWAVMRDDLLLVTDVMGEEADARTAALRELRRHHPDVPFLVLGHPDDTTGGRLMPRGMARVVNASMLLGAVASAYPKWKSSIRVSDPLLPEINSHTYIIKDGSVIVDDSYTGHLDLDVSIDVLADIAFSSRRIGEVMNFPAVRPMISLMLD